jgi:DNA invertase Pin-like site-specific DNA recombinase
MTGGILMADRRAFGYARPSPDPEIAGVEAQGEAIRQYCQKAGLRFDGLFVDRAASGKLWVHQREAGSKLLESLRRGDHLVVVAPHRIGDSFTMVTSTLDTLMNLGIAIHFLDPSIALAPGDPAGRVAVALLSSLIEAANRLNGCRVREAFYYRRREGRRCSGESPYGTRWQRRGRETYAVPDPYEQAILARVGELRRVGYSIDQLRQYLNYTWKVKNRRGREFGYEAVRRMCLRSNGPIEATGPAAAAEPA